MIIEFFFSNFLGLVVYYINATNLKGDILWKQKIEL